MPAPSHPRALTEAVRAARDGDLAAYAEVVAATSAMAAAVAARIARQDADADDAVQEAYVIAHRRLHQLTDPAAFPGWLRRIVITTALAQRRRERTTWITLDEVTAPPVLDADERHWTDDQRRQLARALLALSAEERRWCDLRYHGGWTPERLAEHAGVDIPTMRKRLQRVRDKLREEIEMNEARDHHGTPDDLPARIVDLLARPRLVDIPENPVGAVLGMIREAFTGYAAVELPEEIDLDSARTRLGGDAVYIEAHALQRIAGERVLRYDLSLPMLLDTRWDGWPQRRLAAGKVYRREVESTSHLAAFHQAEAFAIDRRGALDAWGFAGLVLAAVDRILPGVEIRLTPTTYPMCARAWNLDVLRDEGWVEVLAWGEYADWVLRGVGADPARDIALGAGFGLERLASMRFGIDDIRKIAATRVG